MSGNTLHDIEIDLFDQEITDELIDEIMDTGITWHAIWPANLTEDRYIMTRCREVPEELPSYMSIYATYEAAMSSHSAPLTQ